MEWKDDPEFFKDYLKQRPKDKFAWYLLGKEYLAKGEEGKAAYCFTQAGEIYLAFENGDTPNYERIKHALEDAQSAAASEQTDSTDHRSKWPRRVFISVLLFLLLLLPSLQRVIESSGSKSIDRMTNAEGKNKPVEDQATTDQDKDDPNKLQDFAGYGITYMKDKESASDYGEALNEMIRTRGDRLENNLLVAGYKSADGKWNIWPSKPSLLLSVKTNTKGGQSNISYYDASNCNCEPEDGQAFAGQIDMWKQKQEAEAVVRSAIAAYKERNGKLPSQVGDLYQPYPNNILSGLTPDMKQIFEGILAPGNNQPEQSQTSDDKASNPPSKKKQGAPGHNPLSKPLEIIVDRKNHHLAVVSGDIIVRSYPVGLGGNRTPEGKFEISEKVRNPNGKSNGDFGSRGMTLSDTLYAIHGTNEPDSISKDESLGCVRMNKDDVEELFAMVPLGTKVTIGTGLLPPLPSNQAKSSPKLEPDHPRFGLPSQTEERNPKKVYRWLF
ncbi:L,D-transpeptidase [Paenibacillus albiflavus]|uniref:L,D-transpeptidase n=1 Tax=Paenibacillus albiflavus TaxID=2545760 RepID=A0A4R4E4A2_9BACL|nr:L,D-transpeptidase [Paenibacillus albiflavus]TCZ74279.1 L,D-transpeptidase [Paenibacillus albiflavus]